MARAIVNTITDLSTEVITNTSDITTKKTKNYIINGGFEISQRFGGSSHTTQNSYSLDRWHFNNGQSIQRQAETGLNFEYSCRIVSSASHANAITQRIESSTVKDLRGKTVTFSMLIQLESGTLPNDIQFRVDYANSKDNFGGSTVVINEDFDNTLTLDSTYQLFTKSFLVTNEMADNGFFIQVGGFSTGTAHTVRYAQAMLNEGAIASDFHRAGSDLPKELQLCQRYFCKTYNIDVPVGSVIAAGGRAGSFSQRALGDLSQGSVVFHWSFPVAMRSVPLGQVYSNGTGASGVMKIVGSGDLAATTNTYGETGLHCENLNAATNAAWHEAQMTADAEL